MRAVPIPIIGVSHGLRRGFSNFPAFTAGDVSRFFDASDSEESVADPVAELRSMIAAGLDRLPLPGQGATLVRWQILSMVAARDLSLLKLYEGHTDALAILDELDMPVVPDGSLWGVWCAEPPDARLMLRNDGDDNVRLRGKKSWCSGAAGVSHALVSCWNDEGQPCLAAVELDQPGVRVTSKGWQAVGMAASGSVDVEFSDAHARQIGAPHAYLRRPGFWHGGAGIAACWYGAACAIARRLRMQLHVRIQPQIAQDPHMLAQLGAIDVALSSAAAVLRESAAAIDLHPARDAMMLALRVRLSAEAAATQVLTSATRALGAGPLCRDAHFARMAADLPVFLRQSHAERDLASLGTTIIQPEACPWVL